MYYYAIYAKSQCGFCARAVSLLGAAGFDHALILLDKAPDFHALLKKKYEWETVPIIVKCNKTTGDDIELIGGFTDLVEHLGEDDA